MKFSVAVLMGYLCIVLVSSVPVPEQAFQSQALDRLMVAETDKESTLRDKRTIGLLRQLFPDVSKMIEDKVNTILGEVFKVFGPVVIQNFLGGNRANGVSKNNDAGSTVTVKSPFDDDEDELKSFVDDDDFFVGSKGDSGTKVSLELPTASTDETLKAETSLTPIHTMEMITRNTTEEGTTIADEQNATANSVI